MSRRAAGIVLGALLLPYFVGLGRPDLWDANESLYAEPPREALETGEWLAPPMNYETWFVKPPGVTWITMPFYAALGATEFAGRLPMAIAAAATILLTAAIGARLGGLRAGLLAAAVLATTAKFFMFSRQFAGDVFLTTAWTAAAWLHMRWFQSDGRRRGAVYAGAAILGAAALVKGPVSLVLPAALAALHLRLVRRTDLLRRIRPVGPALLAIAIAAPWFVYMAIAYEGFVDVYFLDHHFGRAFSEMFGGGRGPFYYPPAWFADALPWSLAFPAAIIFWWRSEDRRSDPRFLPLLAAVAILLFFTLSTGKRSVYMLPAYPAMALTIGLTLDRLLDAAEGWRRARWLFQPMLVAVVLMLPLAIWLLAVYPEFRPIGGAAVAILAAWALALHAAARRRSPRFAALSSFALLCILALVVAARLSDMQPYRPARQFAERIAAESRPGDRSGRYSLGLQSLTFYGKRPFFHVRSPDLLREECRKAAQTWVVLEEKDLPILTEDEGLRTEIIDEGVYLQVSLRALRGQKPAKRRLLLARVTHRHHSEAKNTNPLVPMENSASPSD